MSATLPARLRGLYLITPDIASTRELLARLQPLLAAGVACVQYRNKTAGDALRLEQARALRRLCTDVRIPLIINDHVALSAEVGADGVHLGGEDGDVGAARARLGAEAIIGASCYDSLSRAEHAVAAGASYIAFGAFHPSPTKPNARRARPSLLAQSHHLGVPRVAIGGITPASASDLVAAGADLIAVISGVFDAADPLRAAHAYLSAFRTTSP